MPPKRMTANPVKPSRHRAGKNTGVSSDSDSDASDDETTQQEAPAERSIAPPPKVPSAGKITSNLGKVDLNERRRQAQDAEERRVAAQKAARAAAEEGFVTEESEEEDEDEDEEDDSEEEESSSEEEAPRRLMVRPKFVPKNQRNREAGGKPTTEEDEAARFAEEEARKKAAMDEMVEEQIRKDLAAKAAGKKHWDDLVESEEDVSTTDEKEPEAEYAAWKLRELKRIKREREAIEVREKEREETERRRNLTEEERKAEDEEHLAKQKAEQDSKGKMSYMQKYFHKGAFFQDEAKAEGLDQRDIMGTRFADDVKNRELLPQALQMRDMTKLGKRGATKYRDLKSEDTGQWGEFRDRRPGRADFDRYGVDDRFKSDRERERSGPGGANAIPLGERRSAPDAPRGPKSDRDRDGDGYRDRSPGRDRRRDRDRDDQRPRDGYDRRHRSRSPRRDRDRDDYGGRRKRSTSRGDDRYDRDKRRKAENR